MAADAACLNVNARLSIIYRAPNIKRMQPAAVVGRVNNWVFRSIACVTVSMCYSDIQLLPQPGGTSVLIGSHETTDPRSAAVSRLASIQSLSCTTVVIEWAMADQSP